ncbi:MAG: cytochrome c biogenesis protein ResB [bacterium]|nr:cytochrome c biogenesis protein ResB [bacterium]
MNNKLIKVNLFILCLIAVASIVGSILDEVTTQKLVYGSMWFRLTGVSFFFTILITFARLIFELKIPDKRSAGKLGTLIIYFGIVVLFFGIFLGKNSFYGYLALPENEKSNVIFLPDSKLQKRLPFEIYLDKFSIVHYPTEDRIKDFVSKVRIFNKGKEVISGGITPSHPLIYNRHFLLQLGYKYPVILSQDPEQNEGEAKNLTPMSILRVSFNPGLAIIFISYPIILIGMFIVFISTFKR